MSKNAKRPSNEADANAARSNRTPLLDRVKVPADIRDFSVDELRQLADELRDETVDRKSTRLNSSHTDISRMPASA